MRRLRLPLDANVLVDAQSRDLILRAAEAGYVDVYWSERILDETARALKRMLRAGKGAERLIAALRSAFPFSSVAGYQAVEATLALPDDDDRHVLAAASVAECDVIVTSNLRDFPLAACDAHDVLAASVDDALLLIAEQAGPGIADLVHGQIAAMRRPSTTVEAFLERLSERAPNAATTIGSVIGLPDHQRILAEVLRADSSDSPQESVRALLDALRRDDSASVAALVDDRLRQELAPPSGDCNQAASVLRAQLDDVLTGEGWGFATAWRPQAPDMELVELVQEVKKSASSAGHNWSTATSSTCGETMSAGCWSRWTVQTRG